MTAPRWLEQLIALVEKYEGILYCGLLVLLLWPIWTNKYFLTLDGPCHLYNAAVLLDFWRGISTRFFSQFYLVNHQFDPNWFSHITLAVLMRFFSPQLSEKFFLTIYILCFLLCSRWLILYINSANKLLVFIPFLFVYHHVFQMGFYNFSFSLVWMILTWLFFLKFINRWPDYKLIPIGSFILLLTYSAHPIGYLLGFSTLVLLLFFDALEKRPQSAESIKQFLRQIKLVLAAALPSLILVIYFFARRASYPVVAGKDDLFWRGYFFVHLSAIVNLVSAEAPFAEAAFLLVALVSAIAFAIKIRKRIFSRFDAFAVLTAFLVVFYFVSPGAIAGAGMVNERLQIIPFVVLPFWLASAPLPGRVVAATGIIAAGLTVCLMVVRIPAHKLCSEAVTEYVSVGQYIKSESTVLPLSYAHMGKTPEGTVIANKIWLFFHAADYLGTEKPLIMMGNYEGSLGYFPLIWKNRVNPFVYLSTDDGIEATPPKVNIERYEKETNVKIDYVVLLCLDSLYANQPDAKLVLSQLQANYTRIFFSEHGRAVLYERNSLKK